MLFSSFSLDNFLSFLVYGLLLFGFSGASVVCAGLCGKAGRPLETRHDCAVFVIASGRAAKIPRIAGLMSVDIRP
jgi:hypothetical protein